MIDKRDVNGLFVVLVWLLIALWGALDGLSLFVIIYLGVSIALYIETVKQWNFQGLCWEFIVSFIGTVIVLTTAMIYQLSVLEFIDRLDVGPLYLSKLNSSYAGLFLYIAFQARLLRRQHKHICKATEAINGYNGDAVSDKP